jgi:hypothetical protein
MSMRLHGQLECMESMLMVSHPASREQYMSSQPMAWVCLGWLLKLACLLPTNAPSCHKRSSTLCSVPIRLVQG